METRTDTERKKAAITNNSVAPFVHVVFHRRQIHKPKTLQSKRQTKGSNRGRGAGWRQEQKRKNMQDRFGVCLNSGQRRNLAWGFSAS